MNDCVDNEPISGRYCMPIFDQYHDFREWTDIGPILYATIKPIIYMNVCVDNEPISCRYCMPILGQYQDFREWADIGPILNANIRATTNMPTVSRYWANVGFRYFISICRRVIGTNNIICQHRPNDGPIPVIIGPTMPAIELSAKYRPNVGRYVCVYWVHIRSLQ